MSQLHRKITPTQLLVITFGSTVGSGWLFAPYYTAKYAGSYAPFVWIIGAFIMALIMLCFIELAVLHPEPGSMTRFSRRTHGPLIGGIYGLFLWLGMLSLPPIETSAIMQYAANFWPRLGSNELGGFALSNFGLVVAAGVLLLMVMINILALQWFAKVSNVLVIVKIAIPLCLVFVLVGSAFHWSNFSLSTLSKIEIMKHVMEALPLGGVIFAYTGFSNALQLAGEVENPQKAIPLALLGTCLLTSILYLMLQVSFIGAFNPAELALGWQPVDIAAERGPFLVLLEQLKIHSFIPFIAIASCLSPFVAGLISLSGSARTLYALSEDKLLPKSLMALHGGIPVRAVFVNFVIGLMLLIPLPGWDRLIALLVSMIAFVYSIGPISMGTMRLTHKHLHRPFRVKAAHIVAFFALLSTNRIIFWSGAETVYLVCILALVFYAWCLFLKIDASDRFLEFKSSWWILAYVFMLASVAHFGNFGGNGTLTLHQQYSALSMITLIVYVLALASGRRRFRELNS